MKKNKAIYLNIFTVTMSQILTMVVNYVTKQAVQKQLGAEYLGLQTVFGNFCDLMALVFSAAGLVMLFSMYTPMEGHDQGKIRDLYHYYQRIYRIFTAFITALGIALLVVVVPCINSSLTLWVVVSNYLLYLCGVLLYNRFLNNYYFLMADQKRYVDAMVYGIGDILFLIPELGVLYASKNYSLFLLIVAVKNGAECLAISAFVRKEYPYLKEKGGVLGQPEKREIRKNIVNLGISKVGSLLLYNTDSILISAIVNTATAGCYSGYYFISSGLQYLLVAVFDTAMPHIGRLSVHNTRNQQFESYRKVCMLNMAAVVICVCGFYFCAKDLLILWMGKEVLLEDCVIPIMCVNLYITMIRCSSCAYREADGLFADISWVIFLRGVLNIILSILFGICFGLPGIIAATAVSDGATVLWFEPRLLLHSFDKTMRQELQYQLTTIFALATGLFLCGKAVHLVQEVSWLNFFLKVLIILIVCTLWLSLLTGIHLLIQRLMRREKGEQKFMAALEEYKPAEGKRSVSFILPVYNGEKYIETSVRSVLQLKEKNLELLIMDDGSNDRTAEICDRLAMEDDRIRVFHGQNIGQGAERNRGMEAAKGRYIAFIDADDALIPDNMTKLMQLAEDGKFDVLCGNYENTSGSASKLAIYGIPSGEVTRNSIPGTIYQRIKNEGVFCYCWNKLYKRSFVLRSGIRFSTEKDAFMEDALFNLMLFTEKPSYYYLNAPVYRYFVRHGSASHQKNESLSGKTLAMLENYKAFLREKECLDENMDLFVPLAFRQFCWCMYNEAMWNGGNREYVEEKCRQFLNAQCFQNVIDRRNWKHLSLVTSLPQRMLFIYCYHDLKGQHVKRIVWLFCRMYRIMQFYDRYCRVGTGEAE